MAACLVGLLPAFVARWRGGDRCASLLFRAGSPPRRAGNFLLLAQKKVTKEESPNATPCGSTVVLLAGGPAGGRSPLRTFLTVARPTFRVRYARPWRKSVIHRRARCASEPETPMELSLRATSGGHQPPTGLCVRSESDEPHGVCLQALCFGDFHLGQQMKVTRPPGRTPGAKEQACAASTPAAAGNSPAKPSPHQRAPATPFERRTSP